MSRSRSTLTWQGQVHSICTEALITFDSSTATEAEHRSTFYIPYWNVPLLRAIVPRQRQFASDMAVINQCLDGLIRGARNTRKEDDAEALQARDYSQVGCSKTNGSW